MCSGRDTCLFLLDPAPGAERAARAHLRPWLAEQALADDDVHDVVTAVSEAISGIAAYERDAGRVEPIQVSAVLDTDENGKRGVALRVVDQGTMPLDRGTVSDAVDYSQVMMRSAMDEVATQKDPQGGTVITMRTRPLNDRDEEQAAG